jgi:hypothetical protein
VPRGEAIFYIGRVTKLGFDSAQMLSALLRTLPFIDDDIIWSLVGVKEQSADGHAFVHGELTRAKADATVTVLTDTLTTKLEKDEPRLVYATSEFVYLPEFSAIAFRSIPNLIEPRKFIRKFCRIIELSLGDLLVECGIKLLDDLKTFYERLEKIDAITAIKVSVRPPNPLFGRMWESLKQYLADRKAEELSLREIGRKEGISTKLKQLIQLILEADPEKTEKFLRENDLSPTDTAVLMSLDGYGDGRIDGRSAGAHVFIKTHESIVHFTLPAEHNVEAVHAEARKILEDISDERLLRH